MTATTFEKEMNTFASQLNTNDVGHAIVGGAFSACRTDCRLVGVVLEDVDKEGATTPVFHNSDTVIVFELYNGRAFMKVFEPELVERCYRKPLWHKLIGSLDLKFSRHNQYNGFRVLNRLLEDDEYEAHKLFLANGGKYAENADRRIPKGISKQASVKKHKKAKRVKETRETFIAPVKLSVKIINGKGDVADLGGRSIITQKMLDAQKGLFVVLTDDFTHGLDKVVFPKFDLQLNDRVCFSHSTLLVGKRVFRAEQERTSKFHQEVLLCCADGLTSDFDIDAEFEDTL